MEISQIEARQLLELSALWPRAVCVPGTQRVGIVRGLAERLAALMPGWLDEIAAKPIRIEDDGTSRRVHFVAGFRYGYSRATREFSAAFLQNNGCWALADIEHDDGRANFDPLIPSPTWNRRIGYALLDKARKWVRNAMKITPWPFAGLSISSRGRHGASRGWPGRSLRTFQRNPCVRCWHKHWPSNLPCWRWPANAASACIAIPSPTVS